MRKYQEYLDVSADYLDLFDQMRGMIDNQKDNFEKLTLDTLKMCNANILSAKSLWSLPEFLNSIAFVCKELPFMLRPLVREKGTEEFMEVTVENSGDFASLEGKLELKLVGYPMENKRFNYFGGIICTSSENVENEFNKYRKFLMEQKDLELLKLKIVELRVLALIFLEYTEV